MLLRQKVLIEGCRAMAYWTGLHLDLSHSLEDKSERQKSDDILQLMTPVVKSFLTDEGYFCIDQGLQSMGGSGFTQDWPVEQLLRDARISRIYEGTNGIQALDLVGRKLSMQGGRLAKTYFAELSTLLKDVSNEKHKAACGAFLSSLQGALMWLSKEAVKDPEQAGAIASPLLRMFALTSLAVLWAKMASTAEKAEVTRKYSAEFISSKSKSADHFYRLFLPEIKALEKEIAAGKSTLMNFSEMEF
jgi:hypothetical protein